MQNNHQPEQLFPEVKVVEASAGSGKTYALAKRYLQLLFQPQSGGAPVPLRSILAVTFTNKAAREMKERILEFLKRIALDSFSGDKEKQAVCADIGAAENAARQKAFSILDEIMRNYNFFQVQTIDSFINVILSGCAAELNVSANFRIQKEYLDFLRYGLDRCIEPANHDKKRKKLFLDFLDQYLYLENKTGWYPKQDMLDIIKELFSRANIYGKEFRAFPAKISEITAAKKQTLRALGKLRRECAEGMNKNFLKAVDKILREHPEQFDLKDFSSVYFTRDTLPVNKGGACGGAARRLWQETRRLLAGVSEKEALSLFNCYIGIFSLVYAQVRESARRRDIIFLEELNRQARVLFEEKEIGVPELYYRLAGRFRHYLIDEFQDTSLLQWKNIFPMIEDALAAGGSLFYVGDKKQAVYRFRGGAVELFDEIKDGLARFNVNASLRLNVNYRSQREIVLFNNGVFSPENLRNFLERRQPQDKNDPRYFSAEDMERIIAVFRDSRQEYRPENSQGYVRAERVECADNDEKESVLRQKLTGLIDSLRGRFAAADIAILCRSNREIETVTGWLIAEKIEVESERTLNILNNPLIKELISFLEFLNSPIDDLAFISFITGEIFGRVSGLKYADIEEFLLERKSRAAGGVGSSLYREFRGRYPELWEEIISGFFKNVGFVPVYELTVSIFEKLSVFRNFPAYQGFFMRLLELIREQEEEHMELSAFLEYLKTAPEGELYVNFSDEHAVKVVSIHKAKGLGFPAVIIPFLELEIRDLGARTRGLNASYVIYEPDERSLGLLRLDDKYIRFSARLAGIYRREYLRALIDELNVIYVAFTRAERELYVFIPYGMSRQNNLARFLIPEDEERGRPAGFVPAQSRKKALTFPVPAPAYRDWVALLKEEFIEQSEIRAHEALLRGEILHVMLSRVEYVRAESIDAVLAAAADYARRLFPGYDGFDRDMALLKKILTAESTAVFFSAGAGSLFREKEIVDRSGRTKRIDRLLVKDDAVWVIDFKTSRENAAASRAQTAEYMRLAREIYPGKTIRGFLVFMETAQAEECHE